MRLTGALLLTAAGLMAGLSGAGRLSRRAGMREALCRMLAMLGFELGRFRTPLPALFELLARRLDGEGAALCRRTAEGLETLGERDFSQIWEAALEPLPEQERDILLPLGTVLGRYDAQEQAQAVARCLRDMELARDSARAEAGEKGRVYTALGGAAGVMLSILLL